MSRSKIALLFLLALAQVACIASALAVPTPAPTQQPTLTRAVPTLLPTITNTANAPEWTATVSKAVVNVREKPGGAVIGSLRSGDFVEIVACAEKWCEIVEPAGFIWRGCLSDNPDELKCEAK